MNQSIKVLIIEDHPFVAEAYTNSLLHLSSLNPDWTFKIDCANDCDSAILKLHDSENTKPYDLIFLDISLPVSSDGKILCGEDLGIKIREVFDHVKIITCTSYNDNYRLNNILKTVDPDGFLIKEDIDFSEIITAVKTVLTDPPYYSKTVIKLLRKQMSSEMILDHMDRKLLYLISIGTKTKDLPNSIPLSIAGIERRKRLLKRALNVQSNDDMSMIQVAKEKGFI